MNKKYSLTNNTKVWCGITLFQIKAEMSFGCIVKGELGGYIEKEENLSQVSGNAWVYGNAQVYGDALVYGDARVYGDALVYGDARVYGNAWVYGNALVYGDARVYGDALVYGDARVYGDAWVYGNAWVYGDALVYGDARVYGDALVYGDAQVYGDAWVYGNAWVSAKLSYTKGWFIGGSDSDKITNITDKTGSTYWKNQYVLGDYEILPIEEERKEIETLKIGDKTYSKTEVEEVIKILEEVKNK